MTRRTVFRTVAVALVLLGVAALIVRPGRGTARAEARVAVPSPLAVGDVVGTIRTTADGGTVAVNGRRVTIVSSSANDVRASARLGLAAALTNASEVETRRANTAKSQRAQAAAQLATMASRTGLTDPEPAYRERVRAVADLEAQRAQAVAAGQPVAGIDAQLADSQQEVFELQLQVTRHTGLIQARDAATTRELAATRAIDTTTRAVRSASIAVTDHPARGGFALPVAGVALVLAGVALIIGERRRDEVARAEPERVALVPDGRNDSRYLEFYRKLGPSSDEAEAPEPVPAHVDLVAEEIEEEIREVKASELPQDAAEAKATKLST